MLHTVILHDPRFGKFEIPHHGPVAVEGDVCCRAFDEESKSICARLKGHSDVHVSCSVDLQGFPTEVIALWPGETPPNPKSLNELMIDALLIAAALIDAGREALLAAQFGHMVMDYDRALEAAHQVAMVEDPIYAASCAAPESDPEPMPETLPEPLPDAPPPLDAVPDALPSAAPSAAPATLPSATPDATPSARPRLALRVMVQAVPSAAPDAVPDAVPAAAPPASPSAPPNAPPDAAHADTEPPAGSGSFVAPASFCDLYGVPSKKA